MNIKDVLNILVKYFPQSPFIITNPWKVLIEPGTTRFHMIFPYIFQILIKSIDNNDDFFIFI